MKKIILIATCIGSISAYGLPTYEPFTEYAAAIAASGSNSINLCTGGYIAPSGEPWSSLNFSGTAGTGTHGVDIYVTNYSAGSVFTDTALGSILPPGFPGLPSAGSSINVLCVNPAQPAANANIVGNSAVLTFAQDITRPTSGTKTLYISYLWSVAQKGQSGPNNVGRYLGFLASTNLVEPSASYPTWSSLFNTFGTSATSPKYFGHGVIGSGPENLEPYDSSAGKNPNPAPATFPLAYNTPYFIVGAFVFTTSGTTSLPDTNIVWVNPSTSGFGGLTPPAPGIANPLAITMSDVGGMVIIDRVGSGALGGLGTNYIANLIIGSTWSYVTGGPEFTNQPVASTVVNVGQNVSLTGGATAAGQSVNYQWVRITAGVTNNVTNGPGGAGGSATVSGATTGTLTLTGVSGSDVGNYQLMATASGTGFNLNSATAAVLLADPQIAVNPANATANYSQTASFTATATTTSAPLSYQWYFGTTPLNNGLQPGGSYAIGASGTTVAGTSFDLTLTLTNVSYQDLGSYTLYVTNSGGAYVASVPASLAVTDPYVVTPPANPSVTTGGTVTFTVLAAGSPELSYQWYEGTTPLVGGGTTGTAIVSGAQTATLKLTGVAADDDGSYYCAITSSSSGQSINSPAATLTVQTPLSVVSPPVSLIERAGDHVGFAVGVSGGGPQFQWSYNGTPISGATSSALAVTNIQTGDQGTYSVVVQNLATAPLTASTTLTVINSTVLPLSQTNLIVARVGDGAQPLSGATGNTLYLDQYTPGGSYVNSSQVPDEPYGQPYGTGSANGVGTDPAILVPGAGADAGYEAMLTLSADNQEYLCFAGYCAAYPFAGTDVTQTAGGGFPTPFPRALALVNAFGVYSRAYTNGGLYSGGNHTIRSTATLDGTNFWTTGQANSGGVKFVNSTVTNYANGSGIPGATAATASGPGTRLIQVVNGALPVAGFSNVRNLVFSDALGALGFGLYAASGTPEPAASATFAATPLQIINSSQPGDFAFSPDNQTLYVADAGTFASTSDSTGGGIQRWDSNGAGYSYSYTLQPLPPATNGAQGLTVDFTAAATWGAGITGAKIYATTYGDAGNSLVEIVDTGAASTPTVLATAGPNQALRGVRFGPAAIAPAITSAPQTNTVTVGSAATFNPPVMGSAPLFYQWYFNSTLLVGATNSTFTTNNTSFASAGNYILVVSNLTAQIASVTNVLNVTEGAPKIIPTPLPNYVEMAGDHIAWDPVVTGTLPITNYWYSGSTLLQSNVTVTPGASVSLALTNIQPASNGTYTLVASNLYGQGSASAVLTVTATRQTLSSNNVVVARIGDGAQTLSGATGNTLYLDQYTPNGGYVNTIQIPDEGAGQPYGTGSSSSASMPFGSPALLFAGAGNDAGYEALLTLAPNGQDLTFAGYCQAYPFAGADVSASAGNGGNQWRGIGTVNAYGYYTLAYTNTGLYSGGGQQVHAAVDIDGNGTNFYATGQSGAASIKYCNINNQHANGLGIVAVAGSSSGPRVVQVINGYLVFSDAAASPIGIYGYFGLPTTPVTATLLLTEPNSPTDFAVSPDLSTAYIADNGAFGGTSVQAGGIQRWDGNLFSGYTYSYTLGTGSGYMVGARALTVDFSASSTWGAGVNGAVLYATTAEAAGNRLLKITDTGAASAATVLVSAGPNQTLAGVRFGPVVVPPGFAAPLQPASGFAGSTVTFSSGAVGSGPLTYQWYFQAGGVGSFAAILNATNATYTIKAAGNGDVGNYYVVVTNPVGLTAQSDTAAFTLLPLPQFISETYLGHDAGFQVKFTGPAGYNYTVWGTTNAALTPVRTTWNLLSIGTFSGGTDSFTDPNTVSNPEQYLRHHNTVSQQALPCIAHMGRCGCRTGQPTGSVLPETGTLRALSRGSPADVRPSQSLLPQLPIMQNLIPISLVALFIGGGENLTFASAESTNASARPLNYEAPALLTGTIYAKDPGQKQVLFKFKRTATRAGSKISVVREYTYPDGKPAVRERAIYDGDDLVSFALEELQIGAAGSATIRREPGNSLRGTISFEYTEGAASGAKPKTSTEALRNDTVISDMVAPFLASHWAELAGGRKVRCRYVVVPRRETVGFAFVKESETTCQGRKAVILRMEATSFIIARLVDPLYFTVEAEAPHRVFQFVGRLTPKVKVGSAWEDLDGLMIFDWPNR